MMTTREEALLQLSVELLKQQQALSSNNHYWQRQALSSYLSYRLEGK